MSLDWQAQAACRDYWPEAWFPEAGDRSGIEAAVEICGSCPVRVQCLAWALETRQAYGVLGGSTEQQRARMLGARLSELHKRVERAPRRPCHGPDCHTLVGRRNDGPVYCSRRCSQRAWEQRKRDARDPYRLDRHTGVGMGCPA